ncbi:response regulator transcription factor [Paenibacillus pinistramenti]|uniref:response regulator transcription factor n=1 Tax=Paenibacillus pinistramenti TaxID=1768003 RepID=UPI001109B419|nr:response regulator [Paenibacillus pinistramenti]
MYTAIIAEDSKPILRHIQRLLESAGLPVRLAATAANGLEALEILKSQPADILLTDIRMPKMNGLELIEQGKLVCPGLQTVLISGYNDFEYVRKALNLQAFDYLLKPLEESQFSQVMQRLVEQLDAQRQMDRKLLEGVVEPEFLPTMALGAELYAADKIMLLVRRQPFTPGAEQWRAPEMRASLEQACAPCGCTVLPAGRPEQFIVLAGAGDAGIPGNAGISAPASAGAWGLAVQSRLQQLGLRAAVLADHLPAGIQPLVSVYGRLDRAMNGRLTIAGELAQPAEADREGGAAPGDAAETVAVRTQLADLIAQRNKERFLLLLRQQLPKWLSRSARLCELERSVRFLAEAFAAVPGTDRDSPGESGCSSPAEEAGQFMAGESLESLGEELLAWAGRKFEALQEPCRKSGEELFGQLDRYLRSRLYAQLSIGDAAQHFHVSPSYISRIVKRYTSDTFVHYYMSLKIAEARRLLATGPDVKVKDVAELLCFADQHYFSKVFKEYAGYSPSEYKDACGTGMR